MTNEINLNLICFIINLAVAVLCGGLMSILPILTRKSFLFGVKIPLEEQNCPEAKRLKKRYVTVCLTGSAIISALIVLQYIIIPDMSLILTMYFPLLFVAVQMAAFIPNWKKAVKLKEEKKWQVTASVFAETKSSHSRGTLSDLPWVWYILSIILIVINVIIILAKYPTLPDIIPTHFDINMKPDAWADKNIFVLMTMPLINLGTILIMLPVGVMFAKARLQIDPQNPALSFTQHRIYRKRMGHSIGFMTLGIAAAMTFIGLMSVFPELNIIPFWPVMILTLFPCVPLVVVSVSSGQGGCRIKPKVITETAAGVHINPAVSGNSYGRGDDKYWAFGLFYHNPEDPSYLIEDRFGNNLGFNYSRLPVKIGAAITVLAIIAVYVWSTVMMYGII